MISQKQYYAHIENLVANTDVRRDEVFDFWLTPNQDLCALTFDFFQRSFEIDFAQFNVLPAQFFFDSSRDVNAWAWPNRGYGIVAINIGTVVRLKNMFFGPDDILVNCSNRSDLISLERMIDTNIPNLCWQSAMFFVYYHEVGHLVERAGEGGFRSIENPDDKTVFVQKNHVDEVDADSFAGIQLARHAIKYWRKLDSEHQTIDRLADIVAIMCSGAALFKLHFIEFSDEFYLREKTHPHSIIRLFIILDTITGYILHVTELAAEAEQVRESFIRKTVLLLDELMPVILCANARTNLMQIYRDSEKAIFKYAHELITLVGHNSTSARNKYNQYAVNLTQRK